MSLYFVHGVMAEEIILKLGLNVGFCFVVGVSYSIFNLCKTFHLIWTVFKKKKKKDVPCI